MTLKECQLDDATIARLNQINAEFYRTTATEFDRTRGQPWPGWARLLPHLPDEAQSLRTLDVGCGNGRFGVFMAEQRTGTIVYHGLDNNQALLAAAEGALADYAHVNTTLAMHDIINTPLPDSRYDVVVLFGVIHHIPSAAKRLQLMRDLAACVAKGGILAFAAWRFYDYERFRRRIVAWPDDIQVEEHDYLLDWRQGEWALRYCHFVDDDEHARLVAATGLLTIADYRADGTTGDANRYSILRF